MNIKALAVLVLILIGTAAVLEFDMPWDSGKQNGEIEKPNIVLVSLESVRPDHMPCYGYERNTTPRLCSFADDDATRYQRAYTPGTFTAISLPAVSTGYYPSELGIYNSYGKLSNDTPTISERLSEAGYRTYFNGVGGVTVQNYLRGYDNESHVREIDEKLINSDRPVFFRLHLWETHIPFTEALPDNKTDKLQYTNKTDLELSKENRKVAPEDRDHLNNIYDENLRLTDKQVYREIIQNIKDSGEYDETMIIFFGDHGEFLGENGYKGHGGVPHTEEMLKVPLIVKFPGQDEGKVSDRLTTTLDIHETVLESAGIQADTSSISLKETRKDPIYSFSYKFYDIITQDYHLSLCLKPRSLPECETRLSAVDENGSFTEVQNPAVRDRLKTQLEKQIENMEEEQNADKEELRDRLEELGYLR